MEKRKATESDELALAKSAAWAWLEHYRSGSDDRTMPEFDVSRTKFKPKPSRYKVEAMKRSDLSLLDRYEIERISKQLHCINSSHANHHGGQNIKQEKKKKKKSKGFSLLGVVYSRRRPAPVVEVGCRPWQGLLKT